ncbi:hypothetical protein N7463_010597 [Penicillium fimorum]|uniref:Uncharacterized protein n=1 Tax=Penicillium fimorum TaxID=1882269 RepID=A0A9W9XL34_9EURO|nr:hypothetical protein N7463_010597 [Penicillium fimorum]
MMNRTRYLNYKRGQKLLIYWITRACKIIIQTSPSDEPVVPVYTAGVSLRTLKLLKSLARDNITTKGKRADDRNQRSRPTPRSPSKAQPIPPLESLDSYRIVDKRPENTSDYVMVEYALIERWVELHRYLQGAWHEVIYKRTSAAVAEKLFKLLSE